MSVYHTWNLSEKRISPDKMGFSKEKTERLEEALRVLASLIPEIVKPEEPKAVGSYLYNWNDDDGGSVELRFSCGHSYILSGGNWHSPKCIVCVAEFERKVARRPSVWTKKTVAALKADKKDEADDKE